MKQRFPWTHIDTGLPKAEYDAAIMAKIKSRCRVLKNGCWEFLGTKNQQGYGFMNYYSKPWPLHRLVLAIAKGPLSKKMKACHSCDYPPCANPDHLFAGTQGENARDSVSKKRHPASKKTMCKRGHSLADAYVDPDGRRHCNICATAKERIRLGWPEKLAYTLPKKQGSPPDMVRVPYVKKGHPVRTICKNGHPMSVHADVYLTPEGYRRCRRCRTAAVGRFVKRLIQTETEGEPRG